MTKARNEYIYQFKGTIRGKQLTYPSLQSKYANQPYYKLKITLPNQPPKILQVFEEKLANPQIWTTLKEAKKGELSNQSFIFACRNLKGHYYLVNWEEVKD